MGCAGRPPRRAQRSPASAGTRRASPSPSTEGAGSCSTPAPACAGSASSSTARPLHGSILYSHLHWDHTQGLPFLPNADRDDADVAVWVPVEADGDDALEVLSRAMSPPHFPITPDQLRGTWTFEAMVPGRRSIEGVDVLTHDIAHKGGRTFGHRLDAGGGSLAYMPDHCPSIADADQIDRDARARRGDRRAGPRRRVRRRRAVDSRALRSRRHRRRHRARPRRLGPQGRARPPRAGTHRRGDGTIERRLADAPMPVVIGREGMWIDTANGGG